MWQDLYCFEPFLARVEIGLEPAKGKECAVNNYWQREKPDILTYTNFEFLCVPNCQTNNGISKRIDST